jgi:hypothetical protein
VVATRDHAAVEGEDRVPELVRRERRPTNARLAGIRLVPAPVRSIVDDDGATQVAQQRLQRRSVTRRLVGRRASRNRGGDYDRRDGAKGHHTLYVASIALGAVGASPAPAQSESVDLADDLRGIRVALERLVALEEIGRRHGEVEILLRRIEMRERRMEPLQRRLASAENEIDDLTENVRTLETMMEQFDTRLQEEIKEGADLPRSETRTMLEDIERTIRSNTERIDEVTLRARLLEVEIAESTDEIEVLDDRLMDLLEADER